MRAIVFSTSRQIRDYIAACDNTLLPKLYTMDEFLRRCVVVPGRIFVDDARRLLYLYRAAEGVDLEKLGFEKSFKSLMTNAPFIFRFFEELHAEQVDLKDLQLADTYADFEDHLAVLQALRRNYAALLEADGMVDRVTMGRYRLGQNFIDQFDRIDIHVDGYLSRFELGVLTQIKRPLFLHFVTTPFNRKLTERLGLELPPHRRVIFDLSAQEAVETEPMDAMDRNRIETAAFDERIDQVAYVLKKIEAFIDDGAEADRIAVIVPDEGFADYLRLFDKAGNFNFAMGTPFTQSRYYRLLADLYDALTGRSESATIKMSDSPVAEAFEKVEGFEDFLAFLEGLDASVKEKEVIEGVLFDFRSYAALLADATPLQLLHTWLRQLEPLRLDDVGGGKITVMGVLESRGKDFDGAVLVDFNEEYVPKVSEKDLFLSSALRRHAGMPTRADKENLQKHYYYRLLQSSRRSAVAYVKNEETLPSRFLYELGFRESENEGPRYRPIIAPVQEPPKPYSNEIAGKNPFRQARSLTPTRLKDWLECPRRYYWRYVVGVRDEEEGDVNVGALIHAALEEAAKNRHTFADAQDYHAFVMDRLYGGAKDATMRFDIALEWADRLAAFCRKDFEDLKEAQSIRPEAWIESEMKGFKLKARVDRIDETPRAIRIIDYKTTRQMKKTLQDPNDFQLLFYERWARTHRPEKVAVPLYVDLYETAWIEPELREKRERLDTLLATLALPEHVEFSMTDERDLCRYCDYKTVCARE